MLGIAQAWKTRMREGKQELGTGGRQAFDGPFFFFFFLCYLVKSQFVTLPFSLSKFPIGIEITFFFPKSVAACGNSCAG